MNTETVRKLRELAIKLDRWADDQVRGGWSTNLVEPMRNEAKEIWAFLGRNGL